MWVWMCKLPSGNLLVSALSSDYEGLYADYCVTMQCIAAMGEDLSKCQWRGVFTEDRATELFAEHMAA